LPPGVWDEPGGEVGIGETYSEENLLMHGGDTLHAELHMQCNKM